MTVNFARISPLSPQIMGKISPACRFWSGVVRVWSGQNSLHPDQKHVNICDAYGGYLSLVRVVRVKCNISHMRARARTRFLSLHFVFVEKDPDHLDQGSKTK